MKEPLKLIVRSSLILFVVLLFVGCNRSSDAANSSKEQQAQQVEEFEATVEWKEFPQQKQLELDQYFQKLAKRNRFSGSVLIWQDSCVFRASHGFLNWKDRSQKIDQNTKFQLASVSKPFTAMAVLKLVQENRLELNDTIQQFFPDFPYPDITLSMLLSHRSGLPDYRYITDSSWLDHGAPMSNDEAYRILLEERPLRYGIPGKKYMYNNSNYFMLANLFSKIPSVGDFQHYMKLLFEELDMQHAWIDASGKYDSLSNTATGHEGRRHPLPNFYQNGVVGDKSMYASPDDLFKFDQALRNETFLSDSIQRLAYQPISKRKFDRKSYGLGWRIFKLRNKNTVVYHNGWWRGFRCYFIRALEDKTTVIVLCNSSQGKTWNAKELLRLVDVK